MGVNLPKFTKVTSPGMRTNWEADAEAAIDAAIDEVVASATVSVNGPCVTNFPRYNAVSNCAALTTGVMTSVALPLPKGFVVTNLTFISATTAAGTPTNYWFALYNGNTRVRQTADQTSTAWAANTEMTLALATPYTVPADGVYYAAVMVKATTPPTLLGVTTHGVKATGVTVTGLEALAQTSDTGLTTTAPATLVMPSVIAAVPLVIAN